MGRIDTLTIDNFKSYGGKHVFGPFHNFTCIIGPNGSGKSNVMDAISFVLGVRSVHLRSVNMNELIHRKHNVISGNHCAVELVYEHDDTHTTTFRRRVDSKGVSTYAVDSKPLTWSDYNSVLESIGILTKVKNFLVYQGDVADTASKSPQQFTELFEHISGSAALRDEYERRKQRAEEVEEQFIRVFERKKNMQKANKVIKQQKDEAERYNELVQVNRELKQTLAMTQLYYSDVDISSKTNELNLNEQALTDRREVADTYISEIETLQAEIGEAKVEAANTEKKAASLQSKIDKLKPDQIKVRQSIEHVNKSIAKQTAALNKLEDERVEHDRQMEQVEKELSVVVSEQAELEELLSSEQGRQFVVAEDRLAEYNRLKLQAGKQLAQLRSELELAKRVSKTDSDRAQQLAKSIDNLNKQRNAIEAELTKHSDDIERYTTALRDKQTTLAAKQKQLVDLRQQHERNAKRMDEVRRLLLDGQQYVAQGDSIKSESKQQQRMNEAIDSLKLHLTGVHGRLVSLIRPIQSKYKIAVSVALGRHSNSIVVDDQKTAIECIKYLKEQRVGVATFIPLDSIKTHVIPESFRSLASTVKLAYDCIEFDEAYERAVSYAVSNTLIVETEDEGKRYAYGAQAVRNRGKIVTLQGTVLHKNNNITGGSHKQLTRVSDYDEKEYQTRQAQISELRAELYRLDAAMAEIRQVHQLEIEIGDLTAHISNIQPTIQHIESQMKQKHQQLTDIDNSIADKQSELDRLNSVIERHQATVDDLTQRLTSEENVIFDEFSRSVGVSNIREYEETHMKLIQQQTDKKLQLESAHQRLQQQLAVLQSRDVQSGIEKLQQIIADNKARLADLKKQEKAVAVEMSQLAVEMDTVNTYMEKLHHQAIEQGSNLKSLKHQLNAVNRDIESHEKAAVVIRGAIKQLRTLRGELVRRCRLEQIELPIVGGGAGERRRSSAAGDKGRKGKKRRSSGDAMELEESKADEDEFYFDVEDEANAELDYSDLTENLDAKTTAQRERVRAEFEHQIAENTLELERLAPNLKAYEKLDQMNVQLKSAQNGYDQIASEHHDAQAAFEQVRQRRVDLFVEAFEHVSREIETIYSQLTKSPEFPTGGRAYLQLESMDEPFSAGIKYTAMPPMKRFRPMDQLSGGEKSIAALALVFAIHSYKPAPFFVLDEVDAALDIPNVQRLSAYIRHRSHEAGSPLQCLVISLKETLYTKSDALIGVCRDQPRNSSAVLHLDLNKYERAQL